MLKWASFSYHGTKNLGDEIQTIAALQFMPVPDYKIDRDLVSEFIPPENELVALISNGWFGHRPESFIPAPNVIPLFVSIHFSEECAPSGLSGAMALGQPEVVSYLKRWVPIGARDLATYDKLQALGIDSYFSGCLTLTLERTDLERDDYVLCIDVPDEVIAKVRSQTSRPIIIDSAAYHHETNIERRFQKAKKLLRLYQRSHCVITSRLHCALPCLAFEVPVFVVDIAPDLYRFSGLNQFFRHSSLEDFVSGNAGFDVDDPEPNGRGHFSYRDNLIATVKKFCANPIMYAEGKKEIGAAYARDTYLGLLRSKIKECEYLKRQRDALLKENVDLKEAASKIRR